MLRTALIMTVTALIIAITILVTGWKLINADDKPCPTKAPPKENSGKVESDSKAKPTSQEDSEAPSEVAEQMKLDATAQIQEAIKAYVESFNAQDAKALAAQWDQDAVYLSPLTGDIIEGRDALEAEFAAQFADLKDAKLDVTTESIEFISPNVAMEKGTALVMQPDSEPERSTYTVIYIKRDGKWLIDRVKEDLEVAVDNSHYEQLKGLEWMVGTWVDRDEEIVVETECKWIGNNNYLLRAFTASSGDENSEVRGMQFIGWDANTKQIRSWVFDSNGGHAEGVWLKKEDRWIVKTKATLANGEIATSTSVFKPLDENTFTWQKVNRLVDGQILPNIDEVYIVRQ